LVFEEGTAQYGLEDFVRSIVLIVYAHAATRKHIAQNILRNTFRAEGLGVPDAVNGGLSRNPVRFDQFSVIAFANFKSS
jgi:hypothetical protein